MRRNRLAALAATLLCLNTHAAVGLKVVNVNWDARQPMQTGATITNTGTDSLGILLGNHGAWGQVADAKTGLCSAMRAQFVKANGIGKGLSAYPDNTWFCRIGEMQNLQIAQGGKNEAVLSFDAPANHLEARFTQPYAGAYADPHLALDWDMSLTIKVRVVTPPKSQPTLKVVEAKAQLKNAKVDSMNFAGDVTVYWLPIGDAIVARLEKDPMVFTALADAQLAAQMKSIVPQGREVAGLWAQSGYALVALNPQPLPPGASENCCDGQIRGRMHWPKSLGAPTQCNAIELERTVFVAPPAIVQPEPPVFSGPPRSTKAFSPLAYTTVAPIDAGTEYQCDFYFGAGSHMAVDMAGARTVVPGKGTQITIIDMHLELPQSLVLAGVTNANYVGVGMNASVPPPKGMGFTPYDPGIGQRRAAAVAGALPSNSSGSRQAPAVATPAWGGAGGGLAGQAVAAQRASPAPGTALSAGTALPAPTAPVATPLQWGGTPTGSSGAAMDPAAPATPAAAPNAAAGRAMAVAPGARVEGQAAPLPPLRVTTKEVARNPERAIVSWVVPEQPARRGVAYFRVLLCPDQANAAGCAGEAARVSPDAGSGFGAGKLLSAEMSASLPGNAYPMHAAQVCAVNAAGQACAEPVALTFWRATASTGIVQLKR